MKIRLTIVPFLFAFCFACAAQHVSKERVLLGPKELSKLLPQRLPGYHIDGESTAKKISIGTLTYAICQRNFSRGKKSVQLLLFDYMDAKVMYDQSMRKWNNMKPVESDSIFFRQSVAADSIHRFDSFRKSNLQSQVVMGIHNRFFLSATASNISFEELKNIVAIIDLNRFPK